MHVVLWCPTLGLPTIKEAVRHDMPWPCQDQALAPHACVMLRLDAGDSFDMQGMHCSGVEGCSVARAHGQSCAAMQRS